MRDPIKRRERFQSAATTLTGATAAASLVSGGLLMSAMANDFQVDQLTKQNAELSTAKSGKRDSREGKAKVKWVKRPEVTKTASPESKPKGKKERKDPTPSSADPTSASPTVSPTTAAPSSASPTVKPTKQPSSDPSSSSPSPTNSPTPTSTPSPTTQPSSTPSSGS
jgi:hypothetical protein